MHPSITLGKCTDDETIVVLVLARDGSTSILPCGSGHHSHTECKITYLGVSDTPQLGLYRRVVNVVSKLMPSDAIQLEGHLERILIGHADWPDLESGRDLARWSRDTKDDTDDKEKKKIR